MIFRKANIAAVIIALSFMLGAFYVVNAGVAVEGVAGEGVEAQGVGGSARGIADCPSNPYCLSYGFINSITPNSFLLGTRSEVVVDYSYGTETTCENVFFDMRIDTYLDNVLKSTQNLPNTNASQYTASQQVSVVGLGVGVHVIKMVFTDIAANVSSIDTEYFEITGTPESCLNNQQNIYLSSWIDPASYPGLVCYSAYIAASQDSDPLNEMVIVDGLPCTSVAGFTWTGAQSGIAYHDFVRYKKVRFFLDDFEQAGDGYENGWTAFAGATAGKRVTPPGSSTGKQIRLISNTTADPDDGAQHMFAVGNYSKIKIGYTRTTKLSAGSPGQFFAEYSFDGITFINLDVPITGTTAKETVGFVIDNLGNANVWLRFYVNGPGLNKFQAFIDNVYVLGEYDGVTNKGPLIRSNGFTAPVCLASTFTLTVNSAGASGVDITSPTGHGDRTNYQKPDLTSGTSVSLTAPAVAGFIFNDWSGGGPTCTGGNPCSVTMDSNKTVIANYSVVAITSLSCSVSPSAMLRGESATWTANVTGGILPFTFTWTSNNAEGPSGTGNPKTVAYNQIGTKTGSVSVSDTMGQSNGPVTCNNSLTVADPECADNEDNDEDGLINCADPGCHTDGNSNNPLSCDPDDNDETNSTFREIFIPFRRALAMIFGF